MRMVSILADHPFLCSYDLCYHFPCIGNSSDCLYKLWFQTCLQLNCLTGLVWQTSAIFGVSAPSVQPFGSGPYLGPSCGFILLQIVIGIFTAIIANQPFHQRKTHLRCYLPTSYGTSLHTILTFSNMFNDSIGAINTQVIPLFARYSLSWTIPSSLGKQILLGQRLPWLWCQSWLRFPYIYVFNFGNSAIDSKWSLWSSLYWWSKCWQNSATLRSQWF